MTSDFEVSEHLANFPGIAPVFPLPNVVLLPHLSLPLHIFEERYRRMTADALEGDGLIALCLLKPGWETDYEGRPDMHEMACLGRITASERLASGRYNIMLTGLARAAVVEEVSTDLQYRTARLELYRDLYPPTAHNNRDNRRKELLFSFRRLFPKAHAESMFMRLFDAEIPLGALCDIIANALQIDAAAKQELLEEIDVDQRSERLVERLRDASSQMALDAETVTFPPEFSRN